MLARARKSLCQTLVSFGAIEYYEITNNASCSTQEGRITLMDDVISSYFLTKLLSSFTQVLTEVVLSKFEVISG